MEGNKVVVLMTACIKPSENNLKNHSIQRSDSKLRLVDYKTALCYWLKYNDSRIKGIVFIENSGFDLSDLKDLARSQNIYKRCVEFIQFEPSEIPKGLHYGYSELEMIDFAFKESEIIKSSNYIIKITGRLLFPKLSKLINEVKNEVFFIADTRDYKILNKEKHFIVTTLLIIEKEFYRRVLFNAKAKMIPNKTDHIETLYLHILKPLYLKFESKIILRFPFNVEPVGIGAHWNTNYQSGRKKIESIFRGLLRLLMPNIWI